MTYTEFKRMHIDLGALGAEGGRNAVRYTCTPKGAKIFGWAGVDGIHFCTVKGYGETIFSVSPMNPGQDCVQPLARDMGDFLRLLLACGDTAALEQAYRSENSISPICSFRIASALFKPSLISVSIVVKLCAVPRIFSFSTSTAVILV